MKAHCPPFVTYAALTIRSYLVPKYFMNLYWYHNGPDWKVGQTYRMNKYSSLKGIAVGLVLAIQQKCLSSFWLAHSLLLSNPVMPHDEQKLTNLIAENWSPCSTPFSISMGTQAFQNRFALFKVPKEESHSA